MATGYPAAVSDAPQNSIPHNILPGCGLAAYTSVLGGMFLLGLTGLFFWTWTVLEANKGAAFGQLVYGGSVSPGMLVPMQQAGVLAVWEVPDVYHAEDLGGESACAIVGREFLRVSPTEKVRFKLEEIKEVRSVEGPSLWPISVTVGVEVVGPVTVTCWFAEGTGEDRLLRILDR